MKKAKALVEGPNYNVMRCGDLHGPRKQSEKEMKMGERKATKGT